MKKAMKIALVDKEVTPADFASLFKEKLKGFPQHRYNVCHTSNTYDQVINGIDEKSIIKIQDFSENYACLLPEEIMLIHWTQEQATLFPVVVLRKVKDIVREEHFVFISNDLQHDVPFVELCNDIIHERYKEMGIKIEHDIEFNDGCASQFKCITAFSNFANRSIPTTRVYFETSHGKSKSDGLGGVVKSFASRNVSAQEVVIRNAKELFDYCEENLTVIDNVENKPMLNRCFFYIPDTQLDEYRSNILENQLLKVLAAPEKLISCLMIH